MSDDLWTLARISMTGADAICDRLLASVPDDMVHTATRNRIVMAGTHVQNALDALAAAQARLPQPKE